MVVRVISIWGSSTFPVMRLARYPRADPKTAPPATAMKYCSRPFGTVSFSATIAPNRMPKRTTAVPSLRRLSPSMMRDNRLSTLRSLKMASTEMGSVAEMMHPKRSAMSTGKPINQCTRYPGTRAASSTPALASNNRGTELRSSSRTSSFTLPSKTSAGRNNIKITSGVSQSGR